MGITFTENVAPVCLPTYDTPQKPGKNCIVSGWGKTDGKFMNDNCLWPKWVATQCCDSCPLHIKVNNSLAKIGLSWYFSANGTVNGLLDYKHCTISKIPLQFFDPLTTPNDKY